jgi:hypothetical protein
MTNQSSKTMSTRSSVFGVAFFFVSSVCAVAGSAASGGAQIAPTDNSSVSTYKVTDTSVGASARDSAGSSSSSSANASSTNSSSSNGAASSNGSAPSGFGIGPHGSNNSSEIATEIKREKVIDTGDKAVETDKVEKATSRDKTFAPGLLDSASDISAVGAQKAQSSASNEGDSQSKAKPAVSEDKGDSKPKN